MVLRYAVETFRQETKSLKRDSIAFELVLLILPIRTLLEGSMESKLKCVLSCFYTPTIHQ